MYCLSSWLIRSCFYTFVTSRITCYYFILLFLVYLFYFATVAYKLTAVNTLVKELKWIIHSPLRISSNDEHGTYQVRHSKYLQIYIYTVIVYEMYWIGSVSSTSLVIVLGCYHLKAAGCEGVVPCLRLFNLSADVLWYFQISDVACELVSH